MLTFINPVALGMAKIPLSFGQFEYSRVKVLGWCKCPVGSMFNCVVSLFVCVWVMGRQVLIPCPSTFLEKDGWWHYLNLTLVHCEALSNKMHPGHTWKRYSASTKKRANIGPTAIRRCHVVSLSARCWPDIPCWLGNVCLGWVSWFFPMLAFPSLLQSTLSTPTLDIMTKLPVMIVRMDGILTCSSNWIVGDI